MQEATLVVDEQLLEFVSLEAKSSIPIAQLSIDKDIEIVRRVSSTYTVGDATKALHVSHIVSQHSVERLTSLEVAVRRLCNVNYPIIIPRVTRIQSANNVAASLPLFLPPDPLHRHYCECDTGDRA